MESQSLTNLFEEKLKSLKEIENAKRKLVYEVNLKYANEYFELVKKVLNEIKTINAPEEIQPNSSIIGDFNTSKSQKKSTAIITSEGMEICLYFDENPFSTPLREKEYDESIINSLLKANGITVKTELPSTKEKYPHTLITYTYEKEKNYTPLHYEETRELTINEGREITSLINTLKDLNLLNDVTFGLPTDQSSIYIFKVSSSHWTVCTRLADYGLENPQFFDTSTRAIQEVIKRIRTNEDVMGIYKTTLKNEEDKDPEYTCNIYGYSINKELKLT